MTKYITTIRIRKLRLVDIVNPRKWFAVVEAKIASRYVSLEFAEQLVYRSTLCRPCVKQGTCKHCGCEVPANMLSATNYCSQGNWGPMWSKGEWNSFKEQYNLVFQAKMLPPMPKVVDINQSS